MNNHQDHEIASMKIASQLRWRRAVIASVMLAVGCIAPAFADIIPPKSYAVTPSGINIADGSLVYSVTDLSIGPLSLERSYRSGNAQPNDPPFGRNFSHNFDIYIVTNKSMPSGTKYPIAHLGRSVSGSFVQTGTTINPNNLDAQKGRLTWSGTQYVYMDSSGTIYTFSATIQAVGMTWAAESRKVERIDFPDGRRQSFSYNASGYLKLVEDSAGYALVFDYDANGDVTAACGFNRAQTYVSATSTCVGASPKTSYGYTVVNSVSYLTSATDVLTKVTSYTNNAQGVSCVRPPGFSSCTMSGSNGNGGATQVLQDGGTWVITGMNPDVLNNPEANYDGDCTNEVSVTDPNSVTTHYTFTKTSPCTMTDANNHTTTYRYEGAHQNHDTGGVYTDGTFLREATFPEGDKYLAEYLGPFKSITTETQVPKPGSGLSSISKTYGYQSCTTSPGTYQNCANLSKLRQADLGTRSQRKPNRLHVCLARRNVVRTSAGANDGCRAAAEAVHVHAEVRIHQEFQRHVGHRSYTDLGDGFGDSMPDRPWRHYSSL
jgi:hypothetical protein